MWQLPSSRCCCHQSTWDWQPSHAIGENRTPCTWRRPRAPPRESSLDPVWQTSPSSSTFKRELGVFCISKCVYGFWGAAALHVWSSLGLRRELHKSVRSRAALLGEDSTVLEKMEERVERKTSLLLLHGGEKKRKKPVRCESASGAVVNCHNPLIKSNRSSTVYASMRPFWCLFPACLLNPESSRAQRDNAPEIFQRQHDNWFVALCEEFWEHWNCCKLLLRREQQL